MITLGKIGGAFTLGIVAYLVVFMSVIHKPLTLGQSFEYTNAKRGYLESVKGQRKLLVLAGSNGRFSHRCEAMAKIIEMPCANLSVAAGSDLYFQLSQYWDLFDSGDILYMPLEFRKAGSNSPWSVGGEGPFVARYKHEFLPELGVRKGLASLFYFDFRFLVSGAGEMILNAAGKKRRFGANTLTPFGDESGHNDQKAIQYEEYIKKLPVPEVDFSVYGDEALWSDLIRVLDWSSEHNIRVIGGLPTIFDELEIPRKSIEEFSKIFLSRGHRFLILDNLSQYPRSQFYDTPYHLRERFQIAHSENLARTLVSEGLLSP